MKKTLLISAISLAMACMPTFQASADNDKSALEQEIKEIVEQVKDFNKEYPAISEDALKVGSIAAALSAGKFLIPFMPTFGKSLLACPVRGCVGAVIFKSVGLYYLNKRYAEEAKQKTVADKILNVVSLNTINSEEEKAKETRKNNLYVGAVVVGALAA